MKRAYDDPAIGMRFSRWTVVGHAFRDEMRRRLVPCRCDCGAEKNVQLRYLWKGNSKGCQACAFIDGRPVHVPAEDRVGQRFGSLIVDSITRSAGRTFAVCRCDCGGSKTAQLNNLVNGMTFSCGCARMQHGYSQTREYHTWATMRNRCANPKVDHWKDYGGRGIRVCKRWNESFLEFFADMGSKPSPKHSIDRIDNDGGYWCGKCEECVAHGRPANCRWATAREQASNKRPSTRERLLTFDGVTLNCAEWAKRIGVSRQCIEQKLSRGYPLERVLCRKNTYIVEPTVHTAHGLSLTLKQWAKQLRISVETIRARRRRGYGWEEALLHELPKRRVEVRRERPVELRDYRCSHCGGMGHQKRKCPQKVAA